MRNSAHARSFVRLLYSFLISVGLGFIFFLSFASSASAQTAQTTPTVMPPATYTDYRTPDVDANVPRNHHTYTQIVVYDVLAAFTCQLVGIDPLNPQQPCLSMNPQTGKLGYVQPQQQFGQAQNDSPQVGGVAGAMANYIAVLYTPTVSSIQYTNYLAANFGIVKTANAQAPPANQPPEDCSASPFGYGFCGLKPIFTMWTLVRDFSYAVLVLAFVFLGVGVMVRFKVDPRTVMTLQNQIPRVIIAILLITFSYAIAGFMIDLMWTVTYTGINIISRDSTAEICNSQDQPQKLSEAASLYLIDQPFSFGDSIFAKGCDTGGILYISTTVSRSFGDLITSVVFNIMGINKDQLDCGLWPFGSAGDCVMGFFVWILELVVSLIIIIALIIALFRVWFELIKTYVTLLIFIILGPLWIVFGLVPGRPLGFEKWLRILFANLAAFPLVAFILVFARVLIDSVPANPAPQSVFVPPLIGNPNVEAFSVLIGFGAIMLAPTIPSMIRERMKATGSGKYGATVAAGAAIAAGVATAPAAKTWSHLNRYNAKTGNPQGMLAVGKAKLTNKILGSSGIGQRWRRGRFGGGYNPNDPPPTPPSGT